MNHKRTEVSSPMAPMCRTESVVHNTTMAVLLEGLAADPEGLCRHAFMYRYKRAIMVTVSSC